MRLLSIRNFTISQRMLLIIQIVSIPILILFVMFLFINSNLQEIQNKIILENVASIRAAYNVETALLSIKGLKVNYILDRNKKWINEFDTNLQNFNYWYNEAFKSAKTDKEKDILSAMAVDLEKYLSNHSMVISFINNGDEEKAVNLLLNQTAESFDAIREGCKEYINVNELLMKNAEKQLRNYFKYSTIVGYSMIFCFFMLAVILFIIITKIILNPIRELEKKGSPIVGEVSNRNEMERLKYRFNKMADTIEDNQQRLIQSERRAAIGEIAAGISHELNNPIGIICGFAEMLLNKKNISKDEMSMIQDIHSESIRCKKLLGQLLDFAKAPETLFEIVDLKGLLRQTVKIFKHQPKYSKITFDCKLPMEKIKAKIDSVQIRQVLMNMLINACDTIQEKGKVDVVLENEGDFVYIIIRDDGQGVSDEIAEEIFRPFFSTKQHGVGLGLPVCRDIIERHNGVLFLNKEYKKGAEFIIMLPRE